MDEKIARRNERVCVALEFVRQIFLGSSVMNTYYTDAHGLTQTQVFWLQTTLNVVFVFSDMPFGYLADKFGIRRIIFTGNLLQLAQGIGFIFCTTFWQFQLALIGTGLYISALSNSSSSLMTASLAYIEDDKERNARYEAYESAASHARSLGLCAGTVGGAITVYIGGISLPYFVQPFVWIVCLVLGLWLLKPTHQIQAHTTRRRLRDTVTLMLRDRPAVRYMILLYAAISCCTFISYWVFQPRLKVAGIDPKYFGAVYFCQYAIVTLLLMQNQRVRGEKKQRDEQIWLWSAIAIASLALCTGLTTGMLPILAYMLVSVYAISLLGVIARGFLHETLPQDYSSRTTELSVMTSIISLLYAAIGPLIGVLTDHLSVGAAYVAITILSLSCALPAYRVFRKHAR
jgi:MFS family permease